jgi:hypothetical protein
MGVPSMDAMTTQDDLERWGGASLTSPARRWPSPCGALSPRSSANGWQVAEAVGDATSDSIPRRLSRVDGRWMPPETTGRPSGARASVTPRRSAFRPSYSPPSLCGSPPGRRGSGEERRCALSAGDARAPRLRGGAQGLATHAYRDQAPAWVEPSREPGGRPRIRCGWPQGLHHDGWGGGAGRSSPGRA